MTLYERARAFLDEPKPNLHWQAVGDLVHVWDLPSLTDWSSSKAALCGLTSDTIGPRAAIPRCPECARIEAHPLTKLLAAVFTDGMNLMIKQK